LDALRRSGLLYTKTTGGVKYCVATPQPVYFDISTIPSTDVIANLCPQQPDEAVVTQLRAADYYIDVTHEVHWDKLSLMIYNICTNLVLKFNLRTEEERTELSHEAYKQTIEKIIRGKLRYTPGKAPVFNLLTTAIIRIMYSIMNKETRTRKNQGKLIDAVLYGTATPNLRSLRVSKSSIYAEA
jgi:hypothetical protein